MISSTKSGMKPQSATQIWTITSEFCNGVTETVDFRIRKLFMNSLSHLRLVAIILYLMHAIRSFSNSGTAREQKLKELSLLIENLSLL